MSNKFQGLGLNVETPVRMTIANPVTGQPLRNAETGEEGWIDLLSASGTIGRAHDRAVTDRRIKSGRRVRAEEIDGDTVEKIAKLTKAWSLVLLDGTPLAVDCTLANARELLGMTETAWLLDQCASFVADVGNFQMAASTS
jgi:hypothetical protein